jgi:FkbM family methyltransferase
VLVAEKRFSDEDVLSFLQDNFPAHRTIVEAGANIGNHTVFFREFLTWERLIAFEPLPQAFRLLKQNVPDKVELYRTALGSREGTAAMKYYETALGLGTVDESAPGPIPLRTLDSFNYPDVTLLRIDVQDNYLNVLHGAMQTLLRCLPLIVIKGDFNAVFPVVQPLSYLCVKYFPSCDVCCFIPRSKISDDWRTK